MNAALPARQGQLAAASERADAQLAEVKRLEIRFRLMRIIMILKDGMMMDDCIGLDEEGPSESWSRLR